MTTAECHPERVAKAYGLCSTCYQRRRDRDMKRIKRQAGRAYRPNAMSDLESAIARWGSVDAAVRNTEFGREDVYRAWLRMQAAVKE